MAGIILVILATIAFLYFAKNIFIPIVLGIFLFFLLDPIVEKLEHKYFPRSVISPILVILVVALLILGAWVTFFTAAQISSHFPEYADKVKTITSFFVTKVERLAESTIKFFPEQTEAVQKVEVMQSVGDITNRALKWLDTIASVIGSIFMVPILTLFFLMERNKLKEKLTAIPLLSHSGKQLAHKIARVVQGFFVGNFIGGLASTIGFFAIFLVLGLENNIALSIGAGFLNIIPIVGAFLAMIFPLAQGLLQFNTITPFLTIATSSVVIHFLVSNLILPKLMGSRVDLNITAATLGMVFWGWLWGAIGIFLAVPLMAIIKILCDLHPRTKPFGIVLSESSRSSTSIIVENSSTSLRESKT